MYYFETTDLWLERNDISIHLHYDWWESSETAYACFSDLSDEGSEVHYTFHKVDSDGEDLNNLIRMLFDNDNRLPDDIGGSFRFEWQSQNCNQPERYLKKSDIPTVVTR